LSSVERDGAQLCADASFVRTHESYRRLFRFISAPVHPRRSAQSNHLELSSTTQDTLACLWTVDPQHLNPWAWLPLQWEWSAASAIRRSFDDGVMRLSESALKPFHHSDSAVMVL